MTCEYCEDDLCVCELEYDPSTVCNNRECGSWRLIHPLGACEL